MPFSCFSLLCIILYLGLIPDILSCRPNIRIRKEKVLKLKSEVTEYFENKLLNMTSMTHDNRMCMMYHFICGVSKEVIMILNESTEESLENYFTEIIKAYDGTPCPYDVETGIVCGTE